MSQPLRNRFHSLLKRTSEQEVWVGCPFLAWAAISNTQDEELHFIKSDKLWAAVYQHYVWVSLLHPTWKIQWSKEEISTSFIGLMSEKSPNKCRLFHGLRNEMFAALGCIQEQYTVHIMQKPVRSSQDASQV